MVSKRKLKNLYEATHVPYWLLAIIILVFILRIPSLFEPFAYGDEMIYLTLGQAIKSGIPLYSGIHDNKPPLLYLTAAVAGNVFWFRAILAIWSVFTIIFFSKLAHALFPKKETLQKVATLIFAILYTIPLLEGNIANSEVFMIGFTILAFWILLSKKLTPKNLILAGVLFSVAALFKIPAAFELPVIIIFWVITVKKLNKKSIKTIFVNSLYLTVGFLVPILLTFVWYWAKGAFNEYLVAAFLQNVGYLSTFRPDVVQEPFLVRNLPLLIRAGIVALGIIILWVNKKRLSNQYIFLTIWLLLALFAVALSERPYPHYLIQIVPIISFYFAMLFTLKNKEQTLVIIPLFLAFFVPYYYNFWHYPTVSYYTRFAKLATGNISKQEYFEGFGGNVVRNYKIADFINKTSRPNDNIFVWGDNASIYALTRKLPPIKFVADYHIKDFSSPQETIQSLNNNPPSFIVIHPGADDFGLLNKFLKQKYILLTQIEESEVWKFIPTSFPDNGF